MRYRIYDWAGNRIGERTFKSFEAGWDYILGELTDALNLSEEDYQEYSVEAKPHTRESRYLDPNDPRSKPVDY